jgi:hypothetical protein
MANQFVNIPGVGGVTIYSTLSAFPVVGMLNSLAVAADTGNLYEYFGGSWQLLSIPGDSLAWGNITGTLSNQTDLQTALNLLASLASPTFTGTVSAPNYTATTSIELPVITGGPFPTTYGVSGFRTGHQFQVAGYGGFANAGTLYFMGAAGTQASPSSLTSGMNIGAVSFAGMDVTGTSYYVPSTPIMALQTTENWSSSNVHGYKIAFSVQANGTSGNPPGNNAYTSLTLDNTGNIILGGDHHLAPNAYTSDLLWGIDGQGDIGSSDGGTTFFRPNNGWIKNNLNIGNNILFQTDGTGTIGTNTTNRPSQINIAPVSAANSALYFAPTTLGSTYSGGHDSRNLIYTDTVTAVNTNNIFQATLYTQLTFSGSATGRYGGAARFDTLGSPTGSGGYFGIFVNMETTGPGANFNNTAGNIAVFTQAYGSTTTGHNCGVFALAQSGKVNYGGNFYATAVSTNTSSYNIGLLSQADAQGTPTQYVGVMARLVSNAGASTAANPVPGVTTALLADNGPTNADIFHAQNAGSDVFSITGAGVVTMGATSSTPQHVLNTATATPASGVGTFTNLPTGYSGNPTGYIQHTINGTTHIIPYW